MAAVALANPAARQPSQCRVLRHRIRPAVGRRAAPRPAATAGPPLPGDRPAAATAATAKDSVELGLELFAAGDAQGALSLFQGAMALSPSADEARAALYNSACAHTRLKQWAPAAAAVVSAVNDYDLKLSVAVADPDLAALRERREWLEALNSARGGVTDVQVAKLRAEAKAPFRLPRLILFGGLAASAAIGLAIITTRLVLALQGGEGAPDLQETVKNFGINSAALAVLGFVLWRDLSGEKADIAAASREEGLARLQVALGDRVVPLAAFRGAARPLIVAGSRGQVARAIEAAEPLRGQLRARGVCLVPLVLEGDDPGERLRRLKAEFSGAAGEGAAPSGKGFGLKAGAKGAAAAAAEPAATGAGALPEKDRKWILDVHDALEWETWLAELKASAGVGADGAAGAAAYVQVQLDGSVRSSGVGAPPYQNLIEYLPELGSLTTRLTDGKGLSGN